MLHKLFHKESMVAEHASRLFRAAPYVMFGCMVLACAIIPSLSTDLPLSPAADAIALVGLFTIAAVYTFLMRSLAPLQRVVRFSRSLGEQVGLTLQQQGNSREVAELTDALNHASQTLQRQLVSIRDNEARVQSQLEHSGVAQIIEARDWLFTRLSQRDVLRKRVEAIPVAGALRFEVMSAGKAGKRVTLRSTRSRPGRPERRAGTPSTTVTATPRPTSSHTVVGTTPACSMARVRAP